MAYKQNNNPFKKTSYISAAKGFDPSGVADELKNNPYAMIAEDLSRVKQGEFGRDATTKDKRNLYQTRAKGNRNSKMSAIRDNTEFYNYTDPRTGQQKQGMNEKYTKPVETDTPSVDVGPGSGSGSGGGEVDWEKVDTGRRQRAAYTRNYGTDMSGSGRRELKRTKRRRLRQQRREARRRERQINRRNSGGGFLARLFGF